MTATITESIEHLDFKPREACQSKRCEADQPPAEWVLRVRCALDMDGLLVCEACRQRWFADMRAVLARSGPPTHKACGARENPLTHAWFEPLP